MRTRTLVFSLAVALAGVGLGSVASAEGSGREATSARSLSGSVLMTTETGAATSGFTREATGSYRQTSSKRAVHTVIKGTSFLGSFASDKREDDRTAPGVERGGHTTISIRPVADQPGVATVVVDRTIILEDRGRTLEEHVAYEAEATFTRGTIDNVADGRDFELVLTKRGQAAVLAATRSSGVLAMERLRDQLVTELGRTTTTSAIAVDRFEADGRTVLKGSAGALEIVDPSVTMTLNLGVTTNG